jgi:hypothetical protein
VVLYSALTLECCLLDLQRFGKGGSGRAAYDADLGVEASDPLLMSFHGTAAAYNKSLRKELINMRVKRDRFLQARINILNPFLIEKVRAQCCVTHNTEHTAYLHHCAHRCT